MNRYIETERLIIRPLTPTDDQAMFAMDNDPEVHRYLGNNPIQSIEAEREVIAFVMRQYEERGIGRWAVEEKATGHFVGWVGFKLMKETVNKHTDFIDFGYRFARQHWNNGYATESGRASLAYGLNTLGYKDIYAMTDIDNGASRRVLEKLGFRLLEIFSYDAEPNWRAANAPTTWYKLVI